MFNLSRIHRQLDITRHVPCHELCLALLLLRVLIDACNLMLCPIYGFRCNQTLVDSASACAADKAVYMCAGDMMNNTAMCTVPCKYDNLAMMVFICHMVLPMCRYVAVLFVTLFG